MRELSELSIPADFRYAEDHEWVKPEADIVRCGISDYAQDQLGDIVFVELPQVGDTFEKGQEFGTVESVKAVSELYMPIGGEITGINRELENSPELINREPYGAGWIIEVKPSDPGQLNELLYRDRYLELLKGLV
jgi:glycine cleavage system H protein